MTAAVSTQVVAAIGGHSPVPLAGVLLVLCLVALCALRPIGRIRLDRPQPGQAVPPAETVDSEPTR